MSSGGTTLGVGRRGLPVASPEKLALIATTKALHCTAWAAVAADEMPMAPSPVLALDTTPATKR